jgi:hypothetical protein
LARRRFPYPVTANAGPFWGSQDTDAATNTDPRFAFQLANVFPEVPEQGSGLRVRPPWQVINGPSPLGSGGARTFQGFGTYRPVDGTTASNFAVCGGKLYRIGALAVPTTFTDITPAAGVTIDASARRVYLVQFGASLIVSDGVNRPWRTTDAHTSVGACTGAYLTDVAQAWYGRPVVYYAKLFGIQATARTTIEWSEELDPDTGYSDATYDNTWVLGLTSSAPLTALCATNDALIYFRRDSIGAISGAVTTDFTTAGTHDAVSSKVGTLAPASVQLIDGTIWFVATDGRPYRYRVGGLPEELWRPGEVTTRPGGSAANIAAMSLVQFNQQTRCVLITDGSAPTDATACTVWTLDGRFVGTWGHEFGSAIDFTALGAWGVDTERTDVLVHGDDDGYVYRQVDIVDNSSTATDTLTYGGGTYPTTSIPWSVQAPALGRDERAQILWDRVTWTVNPGAAGNAVAARHDYQTNLLTFDTAVSLTGTGSASGGDLALDVGIFGHGRWIRPRLRAASATADVDVVRVLDVVVHGTALTDAPGLG